MKYMAGLVLALAVVLQVGCERTPEKETAVQLMFVEFEKDVEPYQTRLIVTEQYMRFDDGEGSRDFILFDRDNDIVYSVNSQEQTIMSVAEKSVAIQPPFELKLEEKKMADMQDAPTIQGLAPLHYQFSVNGQVCYDVVAVAGLMEDVVAAMADFTRVLASDSKLTFSTIPADLHDACDMSMTTFAAGRHFKYGFPVQEWSVRGAGRSLIDFDEDYQPDPLLFELPKEYRRFSLQEFRGGQTSGSE